MMKHEPKMAGASNDCDRMNQVLNEDLAVLRADLKSEREPMEGCRERLRQVEEMGGFALSETLSAISQQTTGPSPKRCDEVLAQACRFQARQPSQPDRQRMPRRRRRAKQR